MALTDAERMQMTMLALMRYSVFSSDSAPNGIPLPINDEDTIYKVGIYNSEAYVVIEDV